MKLVSSRPNRRALPVKVIVQAARQRIIDARTDHAISSALDSAMGTLGCLLDLGLLSPEEWRSHVDDFEHAAQ